MVRERRVRRLNEVIGDERAEEGLVTGAEWIEVIRWEGLRRRLIASGLVRGETAGGEVSSDTSHETENQSVAENILVSGNLGQSLVPAGA